MKSRKLRKYEGELEGVKACISDVGCIVSDGTCGGSDSPCVYHDGDCGVSDQGCIFYDECGPNWDTHGCKWSADFKIAME